MKKFLKYVISSLYLVPILAATPNSGAWAASLTDVELKSSFPGKTFNVKGPSGQIGKIRYSKNGTQTYTTKGFKDTGTWAIKNNTMCSTWKVIREGKTKCFVITKIKNNRWRTNDGNLIWK